MDSQGVRSSIIKTFAYRDVFSYPLTFYQTYSFLIADTAVPFEDFKKEFVGLLSEKTLKFRDNYFHLGGLDVTSRLEREKRSLELIRKAVKISRLLSLLPWIKLICVTGAAAALNSPRNDDIDLLIVTGKGRLWTTRFFVVLILKFFRIYRSDQKEDGMVCPNIFLDETNLEWGEQRNIYTAHEALLMRPIYDRGDYYFRFLSKNAWVKDHLPNASVEIGELPVTSKNGFFLMNVVEKLLMKFQIFYMKKRRTVEVTDENIIHFKRDDNSTWILNAFKKRLLKFLGNDLVKDYINKD